jgi:hypothetical protein
LLSLLDRRFKLGLPMAEIEEKVLEPTQKSQDAGGSQK